MNFGATFATCNLDKESVTAQIRDLNDKGESYWNDKYSDRLVKDLVTIKDFQIVSTTASTKKSEIIKRSFTSVKM